VGHSAIVFVVRLINNNIIKKIHHGLRWPPINVFDSSTNQKWTGMEEKRVEKKDKRGGVAEGCQCATSACGMREGAMYYIVDDRTLLGHEAKCHVPNTAMTASKIAGKPDLIYFNNIVEPLVKIMSIIHETNFYIIYERERRRPAALHCYWCECLLAAILAKPCQLPCIGR
jgi:hypothetical protein